MRFRSQIKNVAVFSKFCASIASLGAIAWFRLNEDDVQVTVIPEKGSQVWSVLKPETVFETYVVQSASPKNTINLEVPIQALQRALKSALNATSAQIRLTKKDNVPMLSLTIVSNTLSSSSGGGGGAAGGGGGGGGVVAAPLRSTNATDPFGEFDFSDDFGSFGGEGGEGRTGGGRERETVITQDVPVKVLPMHAVEDLHEPRTQEPDVNIYLPNLAQVKSVSERFTKLALSAKSGSAMAPRLDLSANMQGSLKIAVQTDALSISSRWSGLTNPELDPAHFPDGSQGIRDHPSTKMKDLAGPDGENLAGWSKVRIDAKDWSRVLSVGRLSARVIACFINGSGLILYVYLPNDDGDGEESCLTYYISSFST